MTTKTPTKATSKKAPAKKSSGKRKPDSVEKARQDAIASIEARLAGKPPVMPKGAKAAKPAKVAKTAAPRRASALDAAATVLAAATGPMRTKEMIAAMSERGLWTSPGGKTPEATLYAAILREIGTKGDAARFRKHDRGLFAARR
jgi:hypothetical protein